MNTLTQIARFCQSVVLYPFRNSISSACCKFNVSRATIYRWRSRYNGTAVSLAPYSKKPLSHPNQHTLEELKLMLHLCKHKQNDYH